MLLADSWTLLMGHKTCTDCHDNDTEPKPTTLADEACIFENV